MKYTAPKRISPFYTHKRIPRKLKKKVKKYCGIHFGEVNSSLCQYMGKDNLEYKQFLIHRICVK